MQAHNWNSFSMFDFKASHNSHSVNDQFAKSPPDDSCKGIDEGLQKVNQML